MDSNHRSKLQQIYSLSPLATRESAHVFNYDTCIVYHNICDYASIFYHNQIITKLFSLIRGLCARDGALVVDLCPRFRYATLLRFCRNYAFNLSMTDETGFYAPSMAHNALPSRPWPGISAPLSIILTDSKQLRYALQ